MRLKGKLLNWNDEKAFGFIAPNGGGKPVFIHKTACSNRQRVPQINDILTFSITTDKQGRQCACDATYSGEQLKIKQPRKMNTFSVSLSVLFLGLLAIALILEYLPKNLVLAYLGFSVITFITYAFDKSKAKHGAWRTPESTLHMLALIGGWPGAAIAQQTLRHKSQKRDFSIMFWLTVMVNCSALAWLISAKGAYLLSVFK